MTEKDKTPGINRMDKIPEESRHLFKLLLESLPQNMYAKDLEGRFVFVNRNFCITRGKTKEELLGKTDYELHPEKRAEQYRRDDKKVVETGELMEFEEEHQVLGGLESFVHVIKTPFYGHDSGQRNWIAR